jgi:hypothetical protein
MSEAEALRFEGKVKMYARVASLLVMTLATTLFLARIVSHHWASYRLVQQFVVAVLCGGVILNCVEDIWSEKGAVRDAGRFRGAVSRSSLLLMAVFLWSGD